MGFHTVDVNDFRGTFRLESSNLLYFMLIPPPKHQRNIPNSTHLQWHHRLKLTKVSSIEMTAGKSECTGSGDFLVWIDPRTDWNSLSSTGKPAFTA